MASATFQQCSDGTYLYGDVEDLMTVPESGLVEHKAMLEAMAENDNSPLAQALLGLKCYREMDFAGARRWIEKSILNGRPEVEKFFPIVLAVLGQMHDVGQGGPMNRKRALELYLTAANSGVQEAQLNLAHMYYSGVDGVLDSNDKEAAHWLERGLSESSRLSGVPMLDSYMNLERKSFLINHGRKRTCEFRGMLTLSKIYLEGNTAEGLRPSPILALKWLTNAANNGSFQAQLWLGAFTIAGLGEFSDVRKGRIWIRKATCGGLQFNDAVQIERWFMEGRLTTATQAVVHVLESEDLPSVPQVEARLISDVKDEIVRLDQGIPLELDSVRMDIRAPIVLSVDFLKNFQNSPTAGRILRAFSIAKEGQRLLQSDPFDESKSKEMLQYFSEAFLLDTTVYQSIAFNRSKLDTTCKRVFSEDPTCEDAVIARLPLHSSSNPDDIEQRIVILTRALQVMEGANHTEEEMLLKLSRVYLLLGSLQYWKKCYESSLKNLERSLELSPDDLTALEGAAECYRGLGQLPESKQRHLQFLSKAPKCHKHYPGAFYRIADINLQMLDVAGFCYYFEKGLESERDRLPFLPEVDLLVKRKLFGFYIATKTDHLPFCSSCLQLETGELQLQRCRRCWSVYYCNRACQGDHWKVHKNSCHQAMKCNSKERENVHLAKQKLLDIITKVHLEDYLQTKSFTTHQLFDDARGLKESIGFDRLQEFHSHTCSAVNSCDSQTPQHAVEESAPHKDKQQGDCDPLLQRKTGPTVHETGRGAAGSLFAAHISPDTPKEVQLAVVREAAEIAKMSIGTTVSKSTKADIGASGQVAIYFDKDHTDIALSNSNQNYFPTRLQSFTGRSHVLEALHKLLAGSSSSILGKKSTSVVALCGLGGTGKSSTAAEYCWLQASYYTSGVYWLSAEFVEESLLEVAALTLGRSHDDLCQSSPKSLAYDVLANISRRPSPWLIIIDNVDIIEQLSNGPLEYVLFGKWKLSSADRGAILVTTRFRRDVAVEELQLPSADNAVELDVFREDEATEFVLKSIPSAEHSRSVAARLSKLLGYLPLALEQATSGIRSMKCKLEDYVKEYKKMSTRLMKRYKARKVDENTADRRMTVLTTWELNFREIMRDPDCGTVAGLFLKLAAYFGADRIPVELINNGLCQESSIAEDIESPVYVRMMVDLLTQLSLFREDLPGRLKVHRLVQEVQRNEMRHNIDTLVDVFEAGVRSLHRALQQHPPPDTTNILACDETGSHRTWGMVAPHCLAFQEHLVHERVQLGVRFLSFLNVEFANIINTSAIYASAIGRQVQSKHLESFKFRLLNGLGDKQDNTSLLPLTTVKLPLETKAQAAVNRAMGAVTEFSPGITTSNRLDSEAENSLWDSEIPKEVCDPLKEDPFFVASCASKTHMHSCQFQKAYESALQCISLKPDRHEGYSLLAELFYNLNCSSINLPRSAATMATFLRSPCCEEEWFKAAYPELKYVEVSSRAGLQQVLERQTFYANHVVILNGDDFVIDTFSVEENMSFVALRKTHMSVFERFVVQKRSSFIGVDVTVSRNPVEIQPTAAVDLIFCKITTKQPGYTGIYLVGSAYLESCVVSECGGGGLKVTGKSGSAVVMSSTFVRNRGAALEVCHQGQLLAMNNKIFENRQGCYLCPFPGQCLIKHNSIYLNNREGVFCLNVSGTDVNLELGAKLFAMLKDDAVSRVHIDFDGNLVSENGSYGISVQQPISVGSMGIISIRNNLVTSNVFWGVFVDTPVGKDRLLVIEKNQIRRNKCGGIFVREFNNTRYSIEQNVIEKNHTPFGSFKKIPYEELTKCNTVRPDNRSGELADGHIWTDPFCCRCHKEMKMLKDDKSGHFCKRCYSVRYCSESCLTGHCEKHSILCKFIRSKYSTVVQLSPPVHPLNPFGRFTASPKSADTFVRSDGSLFVVKVRSIEHDPTPSQSLTLTESNGEYLASFECADLLSVIIECGTIVPGTCSCKEISCWAVAEDAGKSLRLFYHELAPVKRSK